MTSSEHFETIVDGAPGADAERLEASALRPGTHVGRYLVLEPIGEGGMAAVHLAHDPQLHRNVAIKVLHARPGADQARLVREAQALAKLSHPNLVQVYDVGTWGEQVFVAMEYVKGPSLQHWLNRRRSWREVVQCLRAAGEGLVAAHEAGLVHRDFKPGNVLLGDDGRVRVADFGLARLGADPQEREVSTRGDEVAPGDALQTAMTESGVAMGTPAYMAPEQHVAGPVDARCDQFAFCVTLYEGVYGRRPFAVPRRDALLLAKLDGPPAMPSDAKVPSWLRRVIGRGLAPAPEARFESMPALLRAIDEGLFRARRRLGAAGLLAALGITAGLGYAASGSRTQTRCETEPSPIWDEPSRAAVERAFVDTGVALGNDALQLVSARLDVYDDQWRTMHRDACEATHLRGEQSDELLDLRMACLRRRGTQMRATVQVLMEADAEVVENAVEAVAKLPSVEVCADLDALRAIVPLPEAADDRREVEQLEDRLADAYASLNAGRFAPAAEAAEQVAEGARALGYAPLLAEALITQANSIEPDEPGRAESLLREAITTAARGRDDRHHVQAWTRLLFNVGQIQARYDEALSLSVGAEAALARAGDPPSMRAGLESTMGTVEWRRARYDAAVERFARAESLILASVGPDDPRLRQIINNRGVVMLSQGRLDEAQLQFERGLSHARKAFGPRHPFVADSLLNLGVIHAERSEGVQAQARLEEALAVLRSAPNQNRQRIGQVLSNLVVATLQQGELVASRRYALDARDLLRAVNGPEHPSVAAPIDGLAIIALCEGDFDAAAAHATEAMALLERSLGTEHPSHATVALNLAMVRLEQGRPDEASTLTAKARDVFDASLTADSRYRLLADGIWAEAELAHGRAESAIEPLDRARGLVEDRFERARLSFALARALAAVGRSPERVDALVAEAAAAYDQLGFAYWRSRVVQWDERRDRAR